MASTTIQLPGRIGKPLKWLGLLLGAIVATGILFSWKPIKISYLDTLFKDLVSDRYHAHEIDFDDISVKWQPFENQLVFQLDQVRAIDFDGDVIAEIPKVTLGIDIASLLAERIKIRSVVVHNSRINLYRTAGGALKFDIGRSHEGRAGSILEFFLIGLAADPGTFGDIQSFPVVVIDDATLSVEDELWGAGLQARNLKLRLSPNQKGVGAELNMNVPVANEVIDIAATIQYRTTDQISDVVVSFENLYPAVLGSALPGLEALEPFEIRLSGKISGEVSKLLEIDNAAFDVVGDRGSFEVAEYIGSNPGFESIRLSGNYESGAQNLRLDRLVIKMEQGELTSSGMLVWNGDKISILLRSVVSGISLFDLAPRWFAQLPPSLVANFQSHASSEPNFVVTTEGTIDSGKGRFTSEGVINQQNLPGEDINTDQDAFNFAYHIAGPFGSVPKITLRPAK